MSVLNSDVMGTLVVVAASIVFGASFKKWGRESDENIDRAARRRTDGIKRPPINAEFLIYICMSPQDAGAIVGDLEEHYRLLYRKFGRCRANFWYWVQTLISLRPIIWAAIKRPLATVAGMAAAKGLIGHDGWIAAAIEFVKKVRS